MKARSAKAKGTRLEQRVAKAFKGIAEVSRRQPGSGIYADFPHDVVARIEGRDYVLECKARRDGHRTLDRWRGKADMLVICKDFGEPNVYMPLSVLASLVGHHVNAEGGQEADAAGDDGVSLADINGAGFVKPDGNSPE